MPTSCRARPTDTFDAIAFEHWQALLFLAIARTLMSKVRPLVTAAVGSVCTLQSHESAFVASHARPVTAVVLSMVCTCARSYCAALMLGQLAFAMTSDSHFGLFVFSVATLFNAASLAFNTLTVRRWPAETCSPSKRTTRRHSSVHVRCARHRSIRRLPSVRRPSRWAASLALVE